VAIPEPAPVAEPTEQAPAPIGTVRVTASKLNVRSGPSANDAVVGSAGRGEKLALLKRGPKGWFQVALPSGQVGYVSAQFAREVKSCPADREFRVVETPPLSFSDSGAHGEIVVEATVGTDGKVVSTKVVKNATGDPALAILAERELKQARFEAPVRNCAAKRFIYTYHRTF
jgi:hypothetical protein